MRLTITDYDKVLSYIVSLTLKFFCPQDEICISIAEKGGIDALLRCIDDSGEQGNKTVARVCCSLLSKVKNPDY